MTKVYNKSDYPPIEVDVAAFLRSQGIETESHGHELRSPCPLNNHEHDVPGSYAFCISKETGQYYCHKCQEKGNIITLCQKLKWDLPKELQSKSPGKAPKKKPIEKEILSDENRTYLNNRKITDPILEAAGIYPVTHKRSRYFALPVHSMVGDYLGNKLRQFPELGDKKEWDNKGYTAQLYGLHVLAKVPALGMQLVIITESELDALAVISQGVAAVSSTNGAGTWRDDWSRRLLEYDRVYVCLDNDSAGKLGAKKVLGSLWKVGHKNIYNINLPTDTGWKDIGEFLQGNVTIEYITSTWAEPYPLADSTDGFEQMGVAEVAAALDPIIKYDYITKVTIFIACVGSSTEVHVINVAVNGGSSTGKTYNAKNIVNLFPEEDVIKLGNVSKRAFLHMDGDFNKDTNTTTIDFENKIILLLDAPSTEVMETLRSFMSQDEKEIKFSIADKSASGSNKTKDIILRGPAMFVICTAGLHRDEQESTRLLVVSPEVSREKSRMAVDYRISEAANHAKFKANTTEHSSVQMLKRRLLAIKHQRIRQVDIPNSEYLEEVYFRNSRSLQPRHSRDFVRFKALVAGFAMLNYLWREKRDEYTLLATEFDIDQAGILWEQLSEPQELGVAPQILTLYREIIVPAYNEEYKENGITIKDVKAKYFAVHNSDINDKYLRNQIIPTLETAGLIELSQDSGDKRIRRIIPLYGITEDKNNGSPMGGVDLSLQTTGNSFEDIGNPKQSNKEDVEALELRLFEEEYQSASYDPEYDPMFGELS